MKKKYNENCSEDKEVSQLVVISKEVNQIVAVFTSFLFMLQFDLRFFYLYHDFHDKIKII
jgi:hypothetical protein